MVIILFQMYYSTNKNIETLKPKKIGKAIKKTAVAASNDTAKVATVAGNAIAKTAVEAANAIKNAFESNKAKQLLCIFDRFLKPDNWENPIIGKKC